MAESTLEAIRKEETMVDVYILLQAKQERCSRSMRKSIHVRFRVDFREVT
jgi:hypothetical protein